MNHDFFLSNESLIKILRHYHPVTLEETKVAAAVMLIIVNEPNESPAIVVTKRSLTLPHYAGHYSLPGGIRDSNDTDLFATAVREVEEELQIKQENYFKLGQLDDFSDFYGNLVRPFVVEMQKKEFDNLCKPSAHEISEIYFFSLTKLDQIKEEIILITKRRPSYSFKEGHVYIWGLTAAILVHFYKLITMGH